MGFRYVPGDMIRRSDFYEWYSTFPPETKDRIQRRISGFIGENPSCRLPLFTGPGYFMMHWLMADLYTSLAIYLVRREDGAGPEELLAETDRCLTAAGLKLNRLMNGVMKLPGAFFLARLILPKAMTLANGHGFQVTPVNCGRDGFGFDVTECPYRRLYARYGAPEIGPVLCRFDDTLGGGMDNLDFIRKGTLCRGSDKCDFRYRKKDNTCRK